MAKYHVNSKGEPGVCNAKISCPYGDLKEDHFKTKKSAREAYETGKLDEVFVTLKKTTDGIIDEAINDYFDDQDLQDDLRIADEKIFAEHARSGGYEPLATDAEILAGAEKAGWKTFDPTQDVEQFDSQSEDEAPEGWGQSTDELTMEIGAHYEAYLQEQINNMTDAKAYFDADDAGKFEARNYQAEVEDVDYARSHDVLEAIADEESLRGYSTDQLFAQLSTAQSPSSNAGKKNLIIRQELNERYTGFAHDKPVVLDVAQDFSDAYDVGRIYDTSFTNDEDQRIATKYRRLGKGALGAAQENASLAAFNSKELIAALSPLAARTEGETGEAQAQLTLELKRRVKGEVFIPEDEEPPF